MRQGWKSLPRRNAMHRRSFLSTLTKDSLEAQLQMLPESQAALTSMQRGEFAHAIPNWQRAKDIYEQAMGRDHEITLAVEEKLFQSLLLNGNWTQAETSLVHQQKWLPLAQLLMVQGKIDEAQTALMKEQTSSSVSPTFQMIQTLLLFFQGTKSNAETQVALSEMDVDTKDLELMRDQNLAMLMIMSHSSSSVAMTFEDPKLVVEVLFPTAKVKFEEILTTRLEEDGQNGNQHINVVRLQCCLADLESSAGQHTEAISRLNLALRSCDNTSQEKEDIPLALILYRMAHQYHRLGQAVTSEGLFISSLDHFERSQARHTAGVNIEYSHALRQYGLLLHEWDKRESQAAQVSAQSQARLDNILTCFSSRPIPLLGYTTLSNVLLL